MRRRASRPVRRCRARCAGLRWRSTGLKRHPTQLRLTPPRELMACLWNSLMAANAVWTERLDDAYRVLELASTRWEQLAALAATPAGASLSDVSQDEIRRMLIAVIIQRLSATEDALTPAGEETPDLSGLTRLRRLLHMLPASLWPRNDRAEAIQRRLGGVRPDWDIERGLQTGLDSLEIRCLTNLALELITSPNDELERAAIAGEPEAFGSSIVTLMLLITPTPQLGHLSVAIEQLNRASGAPNTPLAVIEQELTTHLTHVETGGADAQRSEAARTAETLDAVLQIMIDPADTDQRLARVDAAIRDHCMPMAESRLIPAIQNAWYALTFAIGEPQRLSYDATRHLLDLATDAAARFAELGERRPVLELIRADLLFILTNSDHAWFAALGTAATAVVEHASDNGLRPADAELFDRHAVARALRYAGVADLYSEQQDASSLNVDAAIDRLAAIAQDRTSDASVRRLSETFAAELAAVRAWDRGAPASDDSGTRLANLRPNLYLFGCLDTDDESFERDQKRINRAFETQLNTMSRVKGLTRDAAHHLEVFTRPWAARRLGLDDAQLLRLGRLVWDVVDHADPEAADLALQVAVNLSGLLGRPESREQYAVLAEDIGERFLACALTRPPTAEAAGAFMSMRASAALNIVAVPDAKYQQRCGLAVAAHLLAVARNNVDLAAQTAYTVAELLPLQGLCRGV